MENKMIRFTLRIDGELFSKFRYVADYEGRSANRELEYYIKRRVARFEQEHGAIENEDDSEE